MWLQLNTPLVASVVAAALYALGERRRLHLVGGRRPGRRRRQAAFAAALAVCIVALSSPIDDLADRLFWLHMVQHMLLMMVAAPLLVLAVPWTAIWRPFPLRLRRTVAGGVARGRWAVPVRWGGRLLGRPLVAWAAFVAALWVWHLPALYDLAVRNQAVHDLEHALFLGTAILFWGHLIASPPLPCRLQPLGRVVYATAAATATWVLCVVLAYLPAASYSAYADLASRPHGISALTDQQLASGVMWGPGAIPLSVVVFVELYRWLGEGETRESRRRRLARRGQIAWEE